jgi:uncharacterized membrane protein YphA (DoxX/SURF4 family)
MPSELRRTLVSAVDDFWMRPSDLRILDVLRRCYGGLLIVWVAWLWIDRRLLFGEGSWVPADVARAILDPDAWNLYSVVPGTPFFVGAALLLLALGGAGLVAGVWPRVAAASSFFLLIAIQHANNLLVDSEDAVFRLFAFYLIFVPPWEQLQWPPSEPHRESRPASRFPAWPLRLFQLQMCLIYLCSAIQKTDGIEWLDGTALYYVFRLDDMVKFHLPQWIPESMGLMRVMTWSVLVFELLAPVLLWLKSTRRACLAVAVAFHLLTDYSLNLHLFHWIMLTGLLSFLKYEEWRLLTSPFRRSRAEVNRMGEPRGGAPGDASPRGIERRTSPP